MRIFYILILLKIDSGIIFIINIIHLQNHLIYTISFFFFIESRIVFDTSSGVDVNNLDKFNPNAGEAYSYYTRTAFNYLIAVRKEKKRKFTSLTLMFKSCHDLKDNK